MGSYERKVNFKKNDLVSNNLCETLALMFHVIDVGRHAATIRAKICKELETNGSLYEDIKPKGVSFSYIAKVIKQVGTFNLELELYAAANIFQLEIIVECNGKKNIYPPRYRDPTKRFQLNLVNGKLEISQCFPYLGGRSLTLPLPKHDPEDDRRKAYFERFGYHDKWVVEDGNSFYRCIAHLLEDNEDFHEEMRIMIAGDVLENPTRYPKLVDTNKSADNKLLELYKAIITPEKNVNSKTFTVTASALQVDLEVHFLYPRKKETYQPMDGIIPLQTIKVFKLRNQFFPMKK